MVIWNDLVWAKTGDDIPALRPSAGSDCLGINGSYSGNSTGKSLSKSIKSLSKSRCKTYKVNKNIRDNKFFPSKGCFCERGWNSWL